MEKVAVWRGSCQWGWTFLSTTTYIYIRIYIDIHRVYMYNINIYIYIYKRWMWCPMTAPSLFFSGLGEHPARPRRWPLAEARLLAHQDRSGEPSFTRMPFSINNRFHLFHLFQVTMSCVRTKKGYGYEPAQKVTSGYHGKVRAIYLGSLRRQVTNCTRSSQSSMLGS